MTSALSQKYFHDEEAAFAALEGIMWPGGKPPHCPHCGVMDRMNRLAVQKSKPSKKNPEGRPVYGLWKCYGCRKQFTVRKGTVFEESHLELHLWFQAAFLMCSSKKGVSANQLHRTLGCTLKTAWFVAHRLREAMASTPTGNLGGEASSSRPIPHTSAAKRRTSTRGNERSKTSAEWVRKSCTLSSSAAAVPLASYPERERQHSAPPLVRQCRS